MLRNVQRLEGLAISATDGAIGKVEDFYFDDEAWVIRYVVMDTSKWLGGREVLISPYSIDRLDRHVDSLPVTVTKDQVRNSPSINSDKPISRQYERGYLGYYGYPYYWGGMGLWGDQSYPSTRLSGMPRPPDGIYQGYLKSPSDGDTHADAHLRSCEAVKGYHLHAKDGDIGHVHGFLVDDSTWSIRYLIVTTSNWWTGHQVLLSPEWIRDVNWSESVVTVDLDRQAIKDAPAYDESEPPLRNTEAALYGHYGRQGYWQESATRAVA
jgi:hypothetical protein